MKTLSRWLLVPALVVGSGYALRAQEPGEDGPTGKILVLKTGHVMEGDIKQVGTQMCVRRGTSEVWIAANKTMRLSPDWLDAYAFMQTLIKEDVASDRIKLARWCHTNKLPAQALEQARIALALQPENADAKQLVTLLERALQEPPPQPTAAKLTPTPTPKLEPVAAVDVTAETLISFSSKVQPILMNTCASCHAADADRKFHLERVSAGGHKVATQRNLAAVLQYVDLDRPTISPLLVKAVTPHGRDLTAPIRDRSAKPFESMQQWIVETIKKNPHLKEYRDAKKPVKTRPEEKPSTFSTHSSSVLPDAGEDVSRPAPRLEVTALKTAPAAPPPERDPFDPAWFNEWAHPRGMQIQTVSAAQR
jgi:hypothetical protein